MKKKRNHLWVGLILVLLLAGLLGNDSSIFAHDHNDTVAIKGHSTMEKVTNIASVVLVSLTILLVILQTGGSRTTLSRLAGMMVAMTSAMMSSIVIGTILGLIVQKLFLSTVIAVLVGMAVGYLTGRALNIMATLDGMLAGIMGGVMGPMLGVMVINDHPLLFVLFMDTVFVLIMAVLFRLLNKEVREGHI
ncbi:MAG: hypothetical protein WD469_13835 [Paenibacillaceae bacterium]